jgi:tetratricopeptide (TPR) repeat protein
MMERFSELLQQAQDAFTDGELQQAVEFALSAENHAAENGRQDLADRAFCNRCALLIELDQGSDQIPRLKQVYLRNTDGKTRWMAAYYVAMAYDLDDETEKAASYAERATLLAEQIGDPEMRGRAANLCGNLALRSSYFSKAEASYTKAMGSHCGADGYQRIMEAQEKDNMGYVLMCTDRVGEGIRLCEEARSTLESMNADHYLHQTLQDLCYGYLLDAELTRAAECGERALELALENEDALVVKNSLFLLSEVAVRAGDTFRARRYLRELAAYYPEVGVSEEIVDVFLATDLTQVVNLRG